MGLIRTLLALAVVDFHAVHLTLSPHVMGLDWVNGEIAVQSFFVVSGFYMAIVLSGKYASQRPSAFYVARALRLYPAYWLACLVTIGILAANGQDRFFNLWGDLVRSRQWGPLLWAFSTNVLIVGQDWNFLVAPRFVAYTVVPQAWTLGIELTFYLLAPWLVRRRTLTLVALAAASLSARALVYHAGYGPDPWTTRVAPLELVWFLFGILSYRAYVHISARLKDPGYGVVAMVVTTIAIIAFPQITQFFQFDLGNGWGYLSEYSFQVLVLLSLPFIFIATRNSRVDRLIGELSYPLYLCHIAALDWIVSLGVGMYRSELIACTALALALGIAIAVVPIERWRDQLSRRKAGRHLPRLAFVRPVPQDVGMRP